MKDLAAKERGRQIGEKERRDGGRLEVVGGSGQGEEKNEMHKWKVFKFTEDRALKEVMKI